MVNNLLFTIVSNIGSLSWFWRCKEHPCPLSLALPYCKVAPWQPQGSSLCSSDVFIIQKLFLRVGKLFLRMGWVWGSTCPHLPEHSRTFRPSGKSKRKLFCQGSSWCPFTKPLGGWYASTLRCLMTIPNIPGDPKKKFRSCFLGTYLKKWKPLLNLHISPHFHHQNWHQSAFCKLSCVRLL